MDIFFSRPNLNTTVNDFLLFYKGCENKAWVGDGFCDDLTNNEACNFDGGDCCGPDVNRQYCMLCQCFKPCKIGNGVYWAIDFLPALLDFIKTMNMLIK